MGSFIIVILIFRSLVDMKGEWNQTEKPQMLNGVHRSPEVSKVARKSQVHRSGEYELAAAPAIPKISDGIIGEAPELDRMKREIGDKSYGYDVKETEIPTTATLQSYGDSYKFTGKPLIGPNPEYSPENSPFISGTSADMNRGSVSLFTSDNAGSIQSGVLAMNNPATETNIADGRPDKPEETLELAAISADSGSRDQSKSNAEGTVLKSNPSSPSSVTVHTKIDYIGIRATPQTSEVHGREGKPFTRISDLSPDPNRKVDDPDITPPQPLSEEWFLKRNIHLDNPKMGSTNK